MVGLDHYELAFGTEDEIMTTPVTVKVTTPPRIYVNWVCDRICPMELMRKDERYYNDFYGNFFRNHKMRLLAVNLHIGSYDGMGKEGRKASFEDIIVYEADPDDASQYSFHDSGSRSSRLGRLHFFDVQDGPPEEFSLFALQMLDIYRSRWQANLQDVLLEQGVNTSGLSRSPPNMRLKHLMLDGHYTSMKGGDQFISGLSDEFLRGTDLQAVARFVTN